MITGELARHLEVLDPIRFAALCGTLISEIGTAAGNPRSCFKTNLAVFDPDGGIDGTCESAPNCIPRTLPRTDVAYQFKSGKVRSAAEVGRVDIVGKPRVLASLKRGGAFVYIAAWDFGSGFEEAVTQAVRERGIQVDDGQIVCIGSSEVALLLADFPALAYEVLGAGEATFLTLADWAGLPTHQSPFESDDRIEALLADIRTRLEAPRAVLRVVGVAGHGKTRIVLQAVSRSELRSTVLYAAQASYVSPPFVTFLRRHRGVRCTLVVDEVNNVEAERLAVTFDGMPNDVRLLTIGVDGSGRASETVVPVPPMRMGTLARLVRAIAVGLDESAAHSIASVCGGSPKLAVLLARRVNANPALAARHRLLADGDVQRGLELYLGADTNDPAWAAIGAIGMVGRVGWLDDVDVESEILFPALSHDAATARRNVERLDAQYGIAPLAGRFRYVSPALLGDHLAARELGTWSTARTASALKALGNGLTRRFAERLRTIAGVLKNRSAFESVIFEANSAFDSLASLEDSPDSAPLLSKWSRLTGFPPRTAVRELDRHEMSRRLVQSMTVGDQASRPATRASRREAAETAQLLPSAP